MRAALALCAVFLLFSPLLFAELTGDELADFGNALDARVVITNTELKQSPQIINVEFEIYNPLDQNMPVYVLRQDSDEGWQIVKLLGGLAPETYTQLVLEIQVQHERTAQKTTRYAIVGRDDEGNLYGKFIEINEDWTEYEKEISRNLTNALIIFVPLIGALLIAVAIIVAQSVYGDKSKIKLSMGWSEYDPETSTLQEARGKPLGEKIADAMIHPATLALELGCVALMVALMADTVAQATGGEDAFKIMALTALGAFTVPFLYFLLSWWLIRMEEGKSARLFVGMFIWGMFVAFLSFIISSSIIVGVQGFATGAYFTIAMILLTPAVEETLKGLGVFLVSGHPEYNDTLTGLMLGFTCGAGFAFVENWFYFSLKANPFDLGMGAWAVFIIYRSFFNTLAHGCFTASLSTLPGYLKDTENLGRYAKLAFIPGLILAISIHAIFNISAVLDQFLMPSREAIFFTFNPLIIILLGAIFFLVLVLAVIDEKRRKLRNAPVLNFSAQPPKNA